MSQKVREIMQKYKLETKQILQTKILRRMIQILQIITQNDKLILSEAQHTQKNSNKLMNLQNEMESQLCQQFRKQIWNENLQELQWLRCCHNML